MSRIGLLLVAWFALGAGVAFPDDGADSGSKSASKAGSPARLVERWCRAAEAGRRALERALVRHGVRSVRPLEAAARNPDTPATLRRRLTRMARERLEAFHRKHTPDGMAYVPAGSLEVPRGARPWGPSGERVLVAAFYMDKLEVTVGAWRRWLARLAVDETERGALSQRPHDPPATADAALPITQVTWNEARAFAEHFRRGRLPTLEEFERALRGSGVATWPWSSDALAGRANLKGYGPGRPLPVGSFPAGKSPFGVLDLVGNVAEWSGTTIDGGNSPLSFRPRVFGGSYRQAPGRELVWRGTRPRGDARSRRAWVGFRVVLDVPEPPEPAAKR